MRHDNQLRYAKAIIAEYDGHTPLNLWLKQYFRENKQMGSTDRKLLSALVYGYYRLGHNNFSSLDERLHTAISIFPDLANYAKNFSHLDTADFSVDKIFPFVDALSANIDPVAFSNSFLIQPSLFLRIRPGKRSAVVHKLEELALKFEMCGDECVALPNSTKIDELFAINRDVVVQDKSSQASGSLLVEAAKHLSTPDLKIWDCCAASGGKSLMAFDLLKGVDLTVSDKRDNIITNLRSRFREAGITQYHSFVADITQTPTAIPEGKYDVIIADVPCSGSGTWARTPEQLFFASMNKVDYYCNLQKSIVKAVMPALKKGGMFVYITCSVFKKENEEVVEFMNLNGMTTIKQQVFAGYEEKADTLFGALLTNSSV